MEKIIDQKNLIPGILYALFTREEDARTGEQYDRSGALVYWTGEGFIDQDGDDRTDFWEWAVPQSTTPDPDYMQPGGADAATQCSADKIDGYDRDDIGESPDF